MTELVKFEIKKIFVNRIILIILASLLILNTALCFVTVKSRSSENFNPKTAEKVYGDYYTSPSAITEYFKELEEQIRSEELIYIAEMRKGNYDYIPPVTPGRYTDSIQEDFALIEKCLSDADSLSEYRNDIYEIKYSALEKAENGNDSFISRYCELTAKKYEKTADEVEIGFEYLHGWEDWFDFGYSDIIIMFAIVIVSVWLALTDLQNSCDGIIRASRFGKKQVALAKIVSVSLVSVLAVLSVMLCNTLIIGLTEGFSSPLNAVQIVPQLRYCVYNIPILSAALITMLMKCAAFAVFSVFCAAVSSWIENVIVSVIFSSAAGGCGIIINLFAYSDSIWKVTNFATLFDAPFFIERYRALDFFGYPVDIVMIFAAELIVILVISSLLIKFKYRTGFNSRAKRKNRKTKGVIYPTSLLYWETKRLLRTFPNVPIVVVLSVCSLLVCVNHYKTVPNYEQTVYERYINEIKGEYTDEKADYIKAELLTYQELSESKDDEIKKYRDGEETYQEYKANIKKIEQAESYIPTLKEIVDYLGYIESANKISDNVRITDYRSTDRIFENCSYIYIVIAAALLCADAFSKERNGIKELILPTAYGRKKHFDTVLSASVGLTLIGIVFITITDAVLILANNDAGDLFASVRSSLGFQSTGINLSVIMFWVISCALRTVSSVAFSVIILSLSEIIGNGLITASCVLMTTAVSAAAFNASNITNIYSLMKDSMSLTVAVAAFFTLSALCLGAVAKRKWSKWNL